MNPLCLSIDEITFITGRVRPHAQLSFLRKVGIVAYRRADGGLVVLRAHFESVMGGANGEASLSGDTPDFSSLE